MSIDKGFSDEVRGGVGDGGTGPAGPGAGGSPIEFRLDDASGVPTYLQLVHQVEHALRLGYLTLGDQLPKVRDVVASLAINPNTMLKAYKELETKGLTAGRPGLPSARWDGYLEFQRARSPCSTGSRGTSSPHRDSAGRHTIPS